MRKRYETSWESHLITRKIDQNRPPVFYHVDDTYIHLLTKAVDNEN